MKWFIASDIHGSAYYARKMVEAYKKENADKMILLGDILYHGPRNDLPKEYNPKEVIDLLNAYKDQILAVRGNCDTEVDQMVLQFPILADYALLPIENTMIFITHGHTFNKQKLPPLAKGDILLHGHTHIPAWEPIGENLYLNPGSVSIPKENTNHGYMILENKTFQWKDLEGTIYHELTI